MVCRRFVAAELQKIAVDAFREFGVPIWTQPSERPPGGDLGRFYWFLPGVVAQSNDFINMHTAGDTPDIVPWTGLEAATRAYAKIIDEVNKLPLKDLQRAATADPNAPASPEGYLSSGQLCGLGEQFIEELRAVNHKGSGREANWGVGAEFPTDHRVSSGDSGNSPIGGTYLDRAAPPCAPTIIWLTVRPTWHCPGAFA